MRIRSGILLFLLLISFILFACSDRKNSQTDTEVLKDEIPAGESMEVKMIFYNMYLPTEMSRIFEKAGANYNPVILNPVDDFSRYDTPQKIALNIGVFGVDLSYCRIFGQNAASAKYFSTIQLLYEKLGIPESYYVDLLNGIEKFYHDKDLLARFAVEFYERADRYLRENEKNATAAMIITGGWIEALYIACKISEQNPDNIEIRERIVSQKYSLNSLISLLNNYQDDIRIAEYLLMLKRLKKSFDQVDIYYNQNQFQLDTVNKMITSSGYAIELTEETLKEICGLISEIRAEIIN